MKGTDELVPQGGIPDKNAPVGQRNDLSVLNLILGALGRAKAAVQPYAAKMPIERQEVPAASVLDYVNFKEAAGRPPHRGELAEAPVNPAKHFAGEVSGAQVGGGGPGPRYGTLFQGDRGYSPMGHSNYKWMYGDTFHDLPVAEKELKRLQALINPRLDQAIIFEGMGDRFGEAKRRGQFNSPEAMIYHDDVLGDLMKKFGGRLGAWGDWAHVRRDFTPAKDVEDQIRAANQLKEMGYKVPHSLLTNPHDSRYVRNSYISAPGSSKDALEENRFLSRIKSIIDYLNWGYKDKKFNVHRQYEEMRPDGTLSKFDQL